MKNQLVTEMSTPITENRGTSQVYLNGRVTMDASYSGGEFTFVLRHVEPVSGGGSDGLLGKMINGNSFLTNFSKTLSQAFNDNLEEQTRNNQSLKDLIKKVRTIIIKDNQLVITSLDTPAPARTPPPPPRSRLPTPAKTK